jgi:hypothetical protein
MTINFKPISRRYVGHLIFVIVFVATGFYLLMGSHAETPFASVEAESGTLNNGASIVSDSSASGGNAISFGGSTTTSNGQTGINPGYDNEVAFNSMTTAQRANVVAGMKKANVTWIRVDIYPGYYNYAEDYSGYGFKVIAILEDFTATPEQLAAFGTQAVDTLKPLDVETYEVLNEVNLYAPTITAAQYVPLLKATYTAIKQADPSATVLTSGLGNNGNTTSTAYPVNYLTAMYADGAKGYFDAVNIHPYTFPQLPTQSGTMFQNIPKLYAIMQANGDDNKKIWITEFGCPTGTDGGYPDACTDATLAEQITDAYTQVKQWDWAGPLLIFDWQDSTNGGDFGLYLANGTAKTQSLAAFTSAAY